jgi:alkylation response protein AidB-like acyl-CoA dehydrogenase
VSSDLLEDLRATTRKALSVDGADDVVDQLDLAGLLVDPGLGGLGLGEREMVLVGEEIGRSVAASKFLPEVVLAPTLLAGLSDIVPEACAVAVAGGDGGWWSIPASVSASAEPDGTLRASGAVWALTSQSAPAELFTAVGTGDGVVLAAIGLDTHARVSVTDDFDATRGLVEVTLHSAMGRRIADGAAAADALAAAYRRALLAVAAEQLGIARACLESTVEYAKTRNQFGAPIGSFQAIKHRCTEVLLDTELADAVLQHGVEADALADAELAFLVASRAAVHAAETCIHVHGGIGFTWEHSAHRYLRRARVNAALLGGSGVHRRAIAESAGL